MKTLENSCDLAPGNPRPTVRKPGQRLVAIDPRRRDINYVKTEEAHETPSTCTHFFDFQNSLVIAVLRHLDTAARERGQASSYCDGYH